MDRSFKIPSFQSGINEYLAEGLIKQYEAVSAKNSNIDSGSLKTVKEPSIVQTMNSNIHSLSVYYDGLYKHIITGVGTELYKGVDKIYNISGSNFDSLNFEYKGKKILVLVSENDTPLLVSNDEIRSLKNRRPVYNDQGTLTGYADADGNIKGTENEVTTYAPKGRFIELHYDRLWIAGDNTNPDRVYFSTASVNGADIEDFTAPIEEAEANQHGGFIDVRSYDGGKIIGLKVVFNALVIFKNKSAYKVFGSNPGNYELVQLFSSNGAVADKSICVGNNGAYFLNNDGIYFYDGTNTNLISQKINNTIKNMNSNYADKSVAIFSDSKYIVSIPTGNSTTNNTTIIYDTKTSSFMIYDIGNINSYVEHNNKVLMATNNYIKSLFGGTNTLPLNWTSPFIDFGFKNTRKMSNYIYFRAKGNGNIKFSLETEKKTKTLEVALTPVETLYRKKLKNKGRMMKLIIENVNGSEFELIAPEVLAELDED